MATKKKAKVEVEPEVILPKLRGKVKVMATKLHLYTPEGRVRFVNGRKAERLIKKGWFEKVDD